MINNTARKTGQEVRLRAMEPEDIDAIYSIENDRDIWEVSSTNVPYSKFALQRYIASATYDIYTDKQVRLIITNEAGEFIGMADLFNYDPQHQRAEMGIVVRKQYRHSGYGLAAIRQLAEYSEKVLHIHQIYAVVGTGNTYCRKLLEKAGFERSSVLKEWIYDGQRYHDAYLLHFFCKKTPKNFVG